MSKAAKRGWLTAILLVVIVGSLGFLLGQTSERAKLNVEEDIRAARIASAEEDIRAVLGGQVEAWNEGRIESFMADYVRGGSLRFASGGTVERGWQPTLERYLRRYPDRAAMGKLSFSELEVDVLDADDALVFGRWRLQREEDAPEGLFTLHMVRQEGRWQIASDHTSSE